MCVQHNRSLNNALSYVKQSLKGNKISQSNTIKNTYKNTKKDTNPNLSVIPRVCLHEKNVLKADRDVICILKGYPFTLISTNSKMMYYVNAYHDRPSYQ